METISRVLFFISHHGFYSAVIFVLSGILCLYIRKKGLWGTLVERWVIPVVLFLIIANAIAGQFLNAWFLNAFGTRGMAIITQQTRTDSKLYNSNAYIYDYTPTYDYDVLVKTPEGKDVVTEFSTTTAAIYPIRNAINIPRTNIFFPVKYIPGYEKNIVILNNESADGLQRNASELMRPVVKARIQYQASPQNKTFIKEYIEAMQNWIAKSTDPKGIQTSEFRDTIEMLQKQL